MDVFVDRKKRVWIVDFNPFGDPSSAFLFEWYELQNLCTSLSEERNLEVMKKEEMPGIEISDISVVDENPVLETEIDFEFRIIKNQNETFSSPAGSSRGPIDVTLAPDFHKFMEICKTQDKEEKAHNDDLTSIDN
jgi:hypothetical protein